MVVHSHKIRPVSQGLAWLFMQISQMLIYYLCLVAQSCLTLCNSMDCSPPGSSVPGDSPGKKTVVGSLSHQGSPRILEWVSYPFSRGSSRPRNWTGVSCIAGRFFTSWATREAVPHPSPALLSLLSCLFQVQDLSVSCDRIQMLLWKISVPECGK